ncbi:FAD-dependent monooxygenase [Amycolatopsis sp. PS_44_ISF1]|uniref:FAD-dependent monooxygenase n=1 Tax=Amycolatopsis sp. PS_44_ISF1 TaxID=2974917 RepID=UPI0028DE50A9|nr:FAD-dependent monooxygenase [Amycolatopsis sp. PS_44_ISF1]MDT8913455.1 FAD-dependent monooxygenase [Amycolatopsis sp. PS_44_ISF1]
MTDVIVAGGGPVGMMAAALLDAAGVRVAVYERNPGPVRQSRGSTMHPRTLEVLSLLDTGTGERISDVLLAQGRRVPDSHFATLPDRLDYRDLDTPFPFVLQISQWRTEAALAELLRTKGVPVRYGAEIVEVAQSPDEVRVRVGQDWHCARFLIGADGAHSPVRKAAGIGFPGTTPDQVGFVADLELAEPVERPLHFWDAGTGHASVVPLTDRLVRVFGVRASDVGLSSSEVRRRQARPLTLAEVAEALTAISGRDFGVHNASWLSRGSTNASRHASAFRVGRVLLAGDAAHVHLPAGGQGLNVGLQDATNLAWKLAAEVHGWAPSRLVTGESGYDAERRPVAEALCVNTQAQDALMHTFTPSGAALRQMFSGFIAQGGELHHELAGTMSGLSLAYPPPDGTHPLTGTRAPDLPLGRRPAGPIPADRGPADRDSVIRALRPDRFLLLDFTPGHSLADLGSARVEVRSAPVPERAGWRGVQAALIRPDGYVAHAATSPAGLAEAVAAWTEPDRHPGASPESEQGPGASAGSEQGPGVSAESDQRPGVSAGPDRRPGVSAESNQRPRVLAGSEQGSVGSAGPDQRAVGSAGPGGRSVVARGC